MARQHLLSNLVDFPVEVTMVDGSRWIVYYRTETPGYAHVLTWVVRDIKDGRIRPADDLDGVQRRLSQINMAHVVSVRAVEGSTSDG